MRVIPKREIALAVVLVCVYLVNKSQGLFYFLPFEFGKNHLNDLIAGILFPIYVNFFFSLSKLSFRLTRLPDLLLVGLICGLCFEVVYPAFNPASTSDPLDLACYVFGCFCYWVFIRSNNP